MEDAWAVFDTAALGIGRAIIEAAQAGERDRGGAHGTGLQGHVDYAIGQPGGAPSGAGLPDRFHFRMRRGIGQFFRAVAGPGQDLARAIYDNGADGHLATGATRPRFFQGQVHEG